MNKQDTKLRAAHVTLQNGRALVITGWRILRRGPDATRVIFAGTRLESPKTKATTMSTRAVLEGKRAA